MTTAASTTDTPSREQLHLAYRHVATPGWPPFEQAISGFPWLDVLAPRARQLHRPSWTTTHAGPVHKLPTGPVPPTPDITPQGTVRTSGARPTVAEKPSLAPFPGKTQRGTWSVTPTPRRGANDCKRAAANDRDDE